MKRLSVLLAVVASGSAVDDCKAEMAANESGAYGDYCAQRCEVWGTDYGTAFCGADILTDGKALSECVYKMEVGACTPKAASDTTVPAPVTTVPVVTTRPTALTTQPTNPTTQGGRTTTTPDPCVDTTVPTTTDPCADTTVAPTVPPTAAPTTSAPTQNAVSTTAPTAAPTTAPHTTTTSKQNSDNDYTSPFDAPDVPDTSAGGPTGPNGECIWGYDSTQAYKQGDYAGVGTTVYQAKQWADPGMAPGSSSLWAQVGTCTGELPKALTVAEMVAQADPNVPTFFYDPWTPTFPSKADGKAVEDSLASDPMTKAMMDAARTLSADEVEKIAPGSASNPENVKRVESFLTADKFEQIFPLRHVAYSYENYLKAIGAFPDYCKTYSDGRDSDAICKKLVAASFAHYAQETGANAPAWTIDQPELDSDHKNPGAQQFFTPGQPIPTYLQGLYFLREVGFDESVTTSAYEACSPVENQPWSIFFPCAEDKTYFGRGSKQLSWNYNYGRFSKAMYPDEPLKLLYEPDLVADTWLNFASGIWFAVTPQSPKPPMTWALDGTWSGSAVDTANGLTPGFGATIAIINGGYECGGGSTSAPAANRIKAYKSFMALLGQEIPADEQLNCDNASDFPPNSPAATKLYWSQDWSKTGACKQDTMQTPFEITRPGDYVRCANFYGRSHIVYQGKEIIKNGGTVW